MNIAQIARATDWLQKWQVTNYTLVSGSLMNEGYDKFCERRFGIGMYYELYVYKAKSIFCYQSGKENQIFGSRIAKRILENPKFLERLISELSTKTNQFRKFIARSQPTAQVFPRFKALHFEYLPLFVSISRSANYIAGKNRAQILNRLERVRLFTESMYIEADDFLKDFLKPIAEREKISLENLTKIHYKELEEYYKTGILPAKSVLAKRGGLYYFNNQVQYLTAAETTEFERRVARLSKSKPGVVRGQSAYPGLIRGRIRIVNNPHLVKQFKQGEILVTGMTRPEFVLLMKKSAAIVTDAGGVLSHAAIVARELKKPCVIGTQTATQVFKDGDFVEVDANKGIVRKI